MSAFFFLVTPHLPLDDWPGAFRLMVHIVGGGSVYLCGLAALWQLAGRPDGAEAASVRLVGSIRKRRAARAH